LCAGWVLQSLVVCMRIIILLVLTGVGVLCCLYVMVRLFFFYWCGDHRDLHSFPTRRSSDLVIVSIFIPKLRLILILNSFLGKSDSLVFSELFHSLAPRPLAARSISDFLLTYLAT